MSKKFIRPFLENNFKSVKIPLVNSTTYYRGKEGKFDDNQHIYSRSSNPNREIVEQAINYLENASESLAFSSGQAASYAVFQALNPGDEVLISKDRYHGTLSLLNEVVNHWGLSLIEFSISDLKALEKKVNSKTALIWVESCSNPLLEVPDLEMISKIAKKNKLTLAVDNTFATPYFCNPISLGADISMNSASKFLGGHSDIISGTLSFAKSLKTELRDRIKNFQILGGAIPSPQDMFLLIRSLETFHIRMPKHAENAMALATYFQNNKKIEKVYYPGLKDSPFNKLAQKQFDGGYGGVITVQIKGNQKTALQFVDSLKEIKHATSLGGTETLVDHRRSVEGDNPISPENLIRIAVGLEPIEFLIDDFEQAFKAVLN